MPQATFMKQNAFSLRRFASLLLFTVLAFTSLGFSAQAEPDLELGKKLYKQNCASCHKLDKKLVGPALAGVSQRRSEQWLIQWIRNNAALRASGDADANAIFAEYGGSIMTNFPSLSDDDIRSIIAYTDAGDAPAAGAVPAAGAAAPAAPVEDNSLVTLIILASFLTLFVVLLLRIRNTLKQVNGEQSTNLREDLDGFTKLLIRNKRFMTFATVVLVLWFLQALFSYLLGIGVEQNYQPHQPIAFSHKVHAGQNKVDCNYCHSSARHSKHSGIPSANVCMNCHMYIDGSEITDSITGQLKYGGERSPEIAKIYEAIGWDAEKRTYTEGYEEKPIKWVRIHNLPDLAYFNHAQHVTAGGVECQTCHGPVETMDEVYQYSELTMGWCINCHRETEVKTESNGYYAEMHDKLKAKYQGEKITVDKIGGLECGKCHY
jgi:mono/diheme cytochrome c family protein